MTTSSTHGEARREGPSLSARLTAVILTTLMLLVGFVIVTPDEADATGRRCRGAKGQVAVRSHYDFEETWSRLRSALDANPNIKVLGEVDHGAAATSAGLDLDPNRVVFFGNPALGTPIMALNPEAGIDLPQNIQVWTQGRRVCVGYNSTGYLAARHGVRQAPTLDTIAGALANFTEAASGRDAKQHWAFNRWVRRNDRLITESSDADFETTWARLNAAIDASPANVAFTVDHSANSGGVLNPLRLVVFGNPNLGTPIMQARATVGIDLPLKILVWEDGEGNVNVSANAADLLRRRHRLGSHRDTLIPVENATTNFLSIATTGAPAG